MSPLNIHPEEAVNVPKKKKNKSLKVMLGIAALVAVPVVGTTLAGSIGINTASNNTIQFGQGVTQAIACDADGVLLTPNATFKNEPAFTDSLFVLETIVIEGIADTCDGNTFTLKFYDSTGDDDALTVSLGTAGTTTDALIAGLTLVTGNPNEWTTARESTATSYSAATVYASDDNTLTFTLDPAILGVDAELVERITLETSS